VLGLTAADGGVLVGDEAVAVDYAFARNASLAAIARLPVVTVPAGIADEARLPVGIDFAGLDGSDDTLVLLAKAFEALAEPIPLPRIHYKPSIFR
jgi:Asp-tRNA(Asn)/Glu-tRNA(Gln) amidotransferase A subunit family amidase